MRSAWCGLVVELLHAAGPLGLERRTEKWHLWPSIALSAETLRASDLKSALLLRHRLFSLFLNDEKLIKSPRPSRLACARFPSFSTTSTMAEDDAKPAAAAAAADDDNSDVEMSGEYTASSVGMQHCTRCVPCLVSLPDGPCTKICGPCVMTEDAAKQANGPESRSFATAAGVCMCAPSLRFKPIIHAADTLDTYCTRGIFHCIL